MKTANGKATNGKASRIGSWNDSPDRAAKNEEHLATMEAAAAEDKKGVTLPPLEIGMLKVTVIGDSELIVHKWSKKAVNEILSKHMGKASVGKERKDPVADFLGTLYIIKPGKVKGDIDNESDDGHPDVTIEGGKFGFPAIAFKNAIVTACTSMGGQITKVQARQAFHVVGELVEIVGTPRMRKDMVKVGMDKPDVRFRGAFKEWRATLTIRFNQRVLSADQLISLLNTAGFGVGVGEWRAEKDGQCGLFHVATNDDLVA